MPFTSMFSVIVVGNSSALSDRAAIRARVYPVCGYDLRGLAAGADGLTCCPECDAAWRLSSEPDDPR